MEPSADGPRPPSFDRGRRAQGRGLREPRGPRHARALKRRWSGPGLAGAATSHGPRPSTHALLARARSDCSRRRRRPSHRGRPVTPLPFLTPPKFVLSYRDGLPPRRGLASGRPRPLRARLPERSRGNGKLRREVTRDSRRHEVGRGDPSKTRGLGSLFSGYGWWIHTRSFVQTPTSPLPTLNPCLGTDQSLLSRTF